MLKAILGEMLRSFSALNVLKEQALRSKQQQHLPSRRRQKQQLPSHQGAKEPSHPR
jgi:hypothetical protein